MSQFIKYQEKSFRGGDRLDSVINKDIGSYLKTNELNKEDKERFMYIEALKSDFRNQNKHLGYNEFSDDNESNNEIIHQEPYKKDYKKANKNDNKYMIFQNSDDNKEQFESPIIEECECNNNNKNNNIVLIIFVVLFVIILGLIILLKTTKSSNMIEMINKLKTSSQV